MKMKRGAIALAAALTTHIHHPIHRKKKKKRKMLVERLPVSLQHLLLLEWLSPESVWVVARASAVFRRAVLTSPQPFSAGETIVADKCVRWFRELGVPLRLWVRMETIDSGEGQVWYQNNMLHRDDDQPAIIYSDGSQKWFQRGKLHRDNDKPAVCWSWGLQMWFRNGIVHRDGDKPAIVRANGTQQWLQDGLFHRDGGKPAIVFADGTEQYYHHGALSGSSPPSFFYLFDRRREK